MGLWVSAMASKTAPVTLNKPRAYIEYVSFTILAFIGANWIGSISGSTLVTFAVGFVFLPLLELFYPKHWKRTDGDERHLGPRYRYILTALTIVLFAISVVLLFVSWQDHARQYQWSLLSGYLKFVSISQLITERKKFKKASFVNE